MTEKKKAKPASKDASKEKKSAKKPAEKKVLPKTAPIQKKPEIKLPVKEKEIRKITVEPSAPLPPPVFTPPVPEKKKILIESPEITIKDLADKMGLKVSDLIKDLLTKGVMATINQRVDIGVIQAVASDFDMELDIKYKKATQKEHQPLKPTEPGNLLPRDPVVTIMGHVDHGKTKLLDAIRKANVVDTEAGGITQHIGAYQVVVNNRKITFLDTPGHEAFTTLRARGAKVTDIAILVVAADDGVMPQTIEAIDHARAAGVPIMVALNKIDKPEANLDRVKKQLSEIDLMPEDWGGKTVTVPVSAKTLKGIEELLEMVILMADMLELKADPKAPGSGIVIESRLDKGRGAVATVLIKNGTIRVGDAFASGETFGKVRALFSDKGNALKDAGPSTPVEILGFSQVPAPGDPLHVAKTDRDAKEMAFSQLQKIEMTRLKRGISLESFSKNIKEGERKDLNLIIKADVQGSLEALLRSLKELAVENIHVSVIHGGVGNISESDVMLAEASQAIIIGFNVSLGGEAKAIAEKEGVDARLYNIIYNVVDDVKAALDGLLEPQYEEVILGTAEVKATYKYSKIGIIAGCFVNSGKLVRGTSIRIKRADKVIFSGKLESLKRFKDDVKEVEKGYECGVALMGYNDFHVGDAIESFEVRVKPRKKITA